MEERGGGEGREFLIPANTSSKYHPVDWANRLRQLDNDIKNGCNNTPGIQGKIMMKTLTKLEVIMMTEVETLDPNLKIVKLKKLR